MILSITLLTLSPPRESCNGRLRFRSLFVWVLLWSLFWTTSVRLIEPFFIDAIDTRVEALRKEVADLEGQCECLLSSIGRSSCFGDQPFISGLR